jgi:inner membrane transporter RhtA
MNLSLYLAIERIGLALAVTLEFLGPLAVALAATRRRLDACCALVALTGVLVLVRPRPTADYVGMGLALAAAACWASYILLNRVVGRRTAGAEGSAAAAATSALIFIPVGVAIVAHHTSDAAAGLHAVRFALVAGVLCSAVPYLVDMFTLRHTTAQSFGLFMSVNPVLAAVVGWIDLGQHLGPMEGIGIAAIVTANAVSLATSSRARPGPDEGGYRALCDDP